MRDFLTEMPRETVLTPEGHEKLKSEIEVLRTVKRREVAERIKEAREFGDISENAEYDHAKNEQAMLEARIAQHKRGEVVTVQVPRGPSRKLKITKIEAD